MSNIPEPKKYGSMSQWIKNSTSRFWCIMQRKRCKMQSNHFQPFWAMETNQAKKEKTIHTRVGQKKTRWIKVRRSKSHSAPSPSQRVGQTSTAPAPAPQHHHHHQQQFQKGKHAPKCRLMKNLQPQTGPGQDIYFFIFLSFWLSLHSSLFFIIYFIIFIFFIIFYHFFIIFHFFNHFFIIF